MTLDIWDILGIPPTKDIRAIRRAYAALSAKHHPEDEPELWQAINRAYRAALSYAGGAGRPGDAVDYTPETGADMDTGFAAAEFPPAAESGADTASETVYGAAPPGDIPAADEWFDFDVPAAESGPDTAHPLVPAALGDAEAILGHYYRRNDLSYWEEFLSSDTVRAVVDQQSFLDGFAALLNNRGGGLWPPTLKCIFDYFHLGDYANPADAGKYARLSGALRNATVYRQFVEKEEKTLAPRKRNLEWLYIILIVVFFTFGPVIIGTILYLFMKRPFLVIPAAVAGVVYRVIRRGRRKNK